MQISNTWTYVDYLQQYTWTYNNFIHQTTGYTPMELFRGRRANFMSDPNDNQHRPDSVQTTENDLVTPGLTEEQMEKLGMRPLTAEEKAARRINVEDPYVRPEFPLWNPDVVGRDGHLLENRITVLPGAIGTYDRPYRRHTLQE